MADNEEPEVKEDVEEPEEEQEEQEEQEEVEEESEPEEEEPEQEEAEDNEPAEDEDNEEESEPETREDKVDSLAEEKFQEAKESDQMFITLSDDKRNYWNSGDELHLIIRQGRCKELPDEMTPVLEHALSEDNKLLREATDNELREEMHIRAEEELISQGVIKPVKKKRGEPLNL